MAETNSIKIKITSDSDPVLRDLQKIEQKAKSAFDKASAAANKTGERIAVLQARMDEIARSKADDLNIGLRWNEAEFDAALQKSLELDSEYKRLAASVARLSPQFEQQKEKVREASAAHEQAAEKVAKHADATGRMNGLSNKARGLFSSLAKRLGALKSNAGKATKETKKHTQAMKQNTKAADPLGKALKRIGTAIKSMLLYMVLRNVINSVKEGFADLAKYSDSTQEALSRLSTAFLYVRNAVTAACKPVLEALAPVIEGVADWFARAANNVAQFTAALFGSGSTYTQAAKAAKEYGDATEKAAKKTDKAMASFDQINQLSFGKQEEPQAPSPDDMFEEDPIDEKVQGLSDKFKAFFEQMKADMGQIWDVFQQSWTQSGQTTIAAAKTALSSILVALGMIGSSFKEVWTDGTGLDLLNNLQGLLQAIFGIIGAIADAFRAAWAENNVGVLLIQAIANMLNAIIALAKSIGQAFIDAWNTNTIGQSILGHILSIATGIVNTVGGLAARFVDAWNAGGTGTAILTAILNIIDAILKDIDRNIQATAKWAESLNFAPLLSGIRAMLEPIAPILSVILQTCSQINDVIIRPFLSWLIQTAIPTLLNLIGSVLEFISKHPAMLKAATQAVAAFVGAWVLKNAIVGLSQVVVVIGNLLKHLSLVQILLGVLVTLFFAVANAWNNMSGLEKAISILGLLAVAAATVAVALHAIAGVAGVALVVGAIVAGIAGVAAAVNSANSRAQFSANAYSSGASPRMASGYDLRSAPIPRLATGAVIPPNNEFLAVLGDQTHGRNVETPEGLLRQIVREESGGNNGGVQQIELLVGYRPGAARTLYVDLAEEDRRRGVKLTEKRR